MAADKNKKRQQLGANSILDNIAKNLPATTRAVKIQNRVAQVGFDWPNIAPVFDKISEEIAELQHEIAQQAPQRQLLDEYGDILFAVTNLGRHLHLDPETALRHTNEKFIKRFQYIEQQLRNAGRSVDEASLEEMERLWEEAKNTVA